MKEAEPNRLYDFSMREIGLMILSLMATLQMAQGDDEAPEGLEECAMSALTKLEHVAKLRVEDLEKFDSLAQSLKEVDTELDQLEQTIRNEKENN